MGGIARPPEAQLVMPNWGEKKIEELNCFLPFLFSKERVLSVCLFCGTCGLHREEECGLVKATLKIKQQDRFVLLYRSLLAFTVGRNSRKEVCADNTLKLDMP